VARVSAKDNVEGIIYLNENYNHTEYKELFKLEDYENYNEGKKGFFSDPFIILVDKDTHKSIYENRGKTIVLESKMNVLDNRSGINVGGVIRGEESNKESIVILTNYDYLGYEENNSYKGLVYNGSSIASSLEIANKLGNSNEKPDRDIIFLFLDSSKYDGSGARKILTHYAELFDENTFSFYINYLGIDESELLYIDISKLSYYNENHYNYIKYMMNRAKDLKIKVQNEMLLNRDEDNYQFIKIANSTVLLFKSVNNGNLSKYLNKKQEDIKQINQNKLKDQSQLILDTITHIAY